ncbi:hypothetical protein PMAYCL1PPCAC_32656, partial [Pristionchus mayeri]
SSVSFKHRHRFRLNLITLSPYLSPFRFVKDGELACLVCNRAATGTHYMAIYFVQWLPLVLPALHCSQEKLHMQTGWSRQTQLLSQSWLQIVPTGSVHCSVRGHGF